MFLINLDDEEVISFMTFCMEVQTPFQIYLKNQLVIIIIIRFI